MAELIAADLAVGLISKLASLAAQEVIQLWNLDKDLEKLGSRFSIIGSLLNDARNKNITLSTAQTWFGKLEDMASFTEAFMDELSYEVTRRNVENHSKVTDLINKRDAARKIKSINASFDENFKLAKDVGLDAVAHLNSTIQPRDDRKVSPYEDTTLIVGRDKDISNLVQIVCNNNQQDLRVVAIIGMGGQGKTTLASMVFHNDDVIPMFTKRMWITVSDDFDYNKILNQMVQSLSSRNLGLDNTQGLVNELQSSINGERFLLVLDDVWNEASEKWDDLRNSLIAVGGAKGSSVIVTTRKQEVINAMRNCVSYPVEKLQEGDSYELFKKTAFRDGGVSEIEPFTVMGRSMVERCGGLPLAIKALGGLLSSQKSEKDWQDIQNSEIWKSQGVLPSLRLSYDKLPFSSLKRCFFYCSIIPKDTRIYKDELIQIWMSLGFLLPPSGSDALMEDIGSKFFNILLWHSLLQDIERDEFGNIQSCKMHDLVHDLALDLSKHHSLTVKTVRELNHVSKATYLRLDKSVSDGNPTILKRDFEKVRLLYAGAGVFRDVLPYIPHLTVLVLDADGVSDEDAGELPKSLRNMKYIKHLDISCLRCKVPSYITELYNLQTLRVWDLEELPKKFCNLINLRHLYIENSWKRSCMFNGIERLTCLQTLPYFVVSKDQNCLIRQLEGLHNLRGEVKLYGLSDVANMQEASKAKLCTKSNIESLLLNWRTDNYKELLNGSSEVKSDTKRENESAIQGLEPHTNLKELIIEYFMGKMLASWITKMTHLVKISLSDCEICGEFPSLGHLPKLREMELVRMGEVRIIRSNCGAAGKVTTIYPSLTKLILARMPKLEVWEEGDTSRGGGDQSSVQVFPKLEVLHFVMCSELTRMPDSSFPSLKKLIISQGGGDIGPICRDLLKNNFHSLSCLELHNCRGLTSLTVGVNLEELKLNGCRGLTLVTVGGALENLRVRECPDLTSINAAKEGGCLRSLDIKRCPCLSVFGKSVIPTIKSLETDDIPGAFTSSGISFPNLTHLTMDGYGNPVKSTLEFGDGHVSAFSALTHLDIQRFKGLKALPDTIAKLPSLEELYIWACDELESLPTFDQPHSIQRLTCSYCDILKERCKESGPEWYKIQHIPIIERP